jgi:RNA polymerase sigma-70 factor, ECF subfamily
MSVQGTTLTYLSSSEEIERLAAAQGGDIAAYVALVRHYAPALYRAAFAVTRDQGSASRLTRDAFIHAWRGIRDLPDSERFYPWLLRVARSLFPTPSPDGAGAPRPEADPSHARETQVLSAYTALRPDEQMILSLRLLERLPYEEISSILDLALAVASLRLSQARGHLVERLAGERPPAEAAVPAAAGSETGGEAA